MDDLHLTRDLLRAINDQARNPGDLFSLVIAHLFDLCPVCENEFQAFKAESEQPSESTYDSAFSKVRSQLSATRKQVSREKVQAESDVRCLLAESESERKRLLLRLPASRRGPALADLLLEESFAAIPARPQESLHLCRLVGTLLNHARTTALTTELFARTQACLGNVKRIEGDLWAASDHFECARFLLRSSGGGDRRVRSEIDWLEGVLRRDQRHFAEAIRLQKRAATTLAMENAAEQAAKVFLSLALTYRDDKKIPNAVSAIEDALRMLEGAPDPSLTWRANHALALCLYDTGEFELAEERLRENQEFYESHGDPLSLLRVSWLEGKIAHGLSELERAEACLQAALRGFQEHGIAYDTALVGLDLARLYLEQGRAREVKALAEKIAQIFEHLEVHQEARAAVQLFQDAARLERVSIQLVSELSSYLGLARRDPGFAFRAPS
jgi:tetratricopeptide (TPR) repeat protein